MSRPDISIVVCTFNRAAMLRGAVQSLSGLETGAFSYEVVVVDNASTDETSRAIAECAAASPVPVRGVHESRKGVSCARNRGIAEARGEWIAFFDDDQLADPRWLTALWTMAREKGVRCVGGAVRLRLPDGVSRDLAPGCRAMLGESVDLDAPQRYTRRVNPGCGNLMVHRSVFDEVGTFDESLQTGGEDTDLFRRIRLAGIDAWYTPDAVVHHLIPPERLEEGSLRWTAQRIGGHVARRERAELGRLAFPPACLSRLVQTLGVVLPRMLMARLSGDAEAALGARCRWWLMTGYLRHSLTMLCPGLFRQKDFLSRLQFRLSRQVDPT